MKKEAIGSDKAELLNAKRQTLRAAEKHQEVLKLKLKQTRIQRKTGEEGSDWQERKMETEFQSSRSLVTGNSGDEGNG